MHSRSRIISVIALLVAVAPAFVSAAVGLRIQPVKISETLTPGQVIHGTVLVSNASDVDVNVTDSMQDFIPIAGADSIQFVGRAPGVTTVRDWLSLDVPKDFTLKQGESKEIGYTIAAPSNAEPGGHFGVMFFKAVDATASTTEQGLRVGTQVGILVLVTIPGNHLQKGKIHDFTTKPFVQGGPVGFQMNFENTGTVHFEPKGQITIYNMFGQTAGIVPIEGQVVLPTSIKKLSFDWPAQGFLAGLYTARASIVDGEGETLTTDTVTFWAFPLWYSGGFLLALIVIYALLRFVRRNVRVSVSLR